MEKENKFDRVSPKKILDRFVKFKKNRNSNYKLSRCRFCPLDIEDALESTLKRYLELKERRSGVNEQARNET